LLTHGKNTTLLPLSSQEVNKNRNIIKKRELDKEKVQVSTKMLLAYKKMSSKEKSASSFFLLF